MPNLGWFRKVDSNLFSTSTMVPTKIPIIKYGRDLLCVLSGQITTTGASVISEDNPLVLVKAIDLVGASGESGKSGSLHRISATELYMLNAFQQGRFPWIQRTGPTTTTAYWFYSAVVLPFDTFPAESLTLLPHPAFTNLELDVTWGAIADLGTNVGTTFTTQPRLDIYELTREFAPPSPPSLMKTIGKQQNLVASGPNDIDLKTGQPIQEILLRVNDNSVRSDTFVTQIDLIENDGIYHLSGIPWNVMQAYNCYRASDNGAGPICFPFVEFGDVITGTTIGLGVTNRATVKGYTYINLMDLEGAPIPTGGMDTFKLRLTTTTSAGGTPNAVVVLRQRVT